VTRMAKAMKAGETDVGCAPGGSDSSSHGRQSRPRRHRQRRGRIFYASPTLGVNFRFCRETGLWPLRLRRFRGSALCMISQAASAETRICLSTGRNVLSCRVRRRPLWQGPGGTLRPGNNCARGSCLARTRHPFFLIGELDQVLRQLVSRIFTLEEVTSLCDLNGSRAIQSFDDLEMGDYQTRRGSPSDPGKPGRAQTSAARFFGRPRPRERAMLSARSLRLEQRRAAGRPARPAQAGGRPAVRRGLRWPIGLGRRPR
jgi:hypothetical protein